MKILGHYVTFEYLITLALFWCALRMIIYAHISMHVHMCTRKRISCKVMSVYSNRLSNLRIWALKDQGLQQEWIYLILFLVNKKVKKKGFRAGQNDEIQIKLYVEYIASGGVHRGISRDFSLFKCFWVANGNMLSILPQCERVLLSCNHNLIFKE